jgi:hypothetical protein
MAGLANLIPSRLANRAEKMSSPSGMAVLVFMSMLLDAI